MNLFKLNSIHSTLFNPFCRFLQNKIIQKDARFEQQKLRNLFLHLLNTHFANVSFPMAKQKVYWNDKKNALLRSLVCHLLNAMSIADFYPYSECLKGVIMHFVLQPFTWECKKERKKERERRLVILEKQ